jgi:FHA domain
MGLLRHVASGTTCTLASRTLVGRGPACVVRANDPRVSSEHAVLAWSGDTWTVRDLGSRNATTLDDRPLAAGDEARLVAGARLKFGGDLWVLHDDAPPVPQAVRLDDDARVTAQGPVLLLPDADSPLASLVPQADGLWRLEDDGDGRAVSDLDVVEVGGRAYRVYLPTVSTPTVPADAVAALRFRVSTDEEHVEVAVVGGGRTTHLRARSHHYLLLVLARQRMQDQALPAVDRGWVTRDDLARRLRVEPITVNVQLHRIRHDLGRHGDAAAGLVEIRPGSGHVRVGTDDVAVETSR